MQFLAKIFSLKIDPLPPLSEGWLYSVHMWIFNVMPNKKNVH